MEPRLDMQHLSRGRRLSTRAGKKIYILYYYFIYIFLYLFYIAQLKGAPWIPSGKKKKRETRSSTDLLVQLSLEGSWHDYFTLNRKNQEVSCLIVVGFTLQRIDPRIDGDKNGTALEDLEELAKVHLCLSNCLFYLVVVFVIYMQ